MEYLRNLKVDKFFRVLKTMEKKTITSVDIWHHEEGRT